MFEFIYSRKRIRNIGSEISKEYKDMPSVIPLLWTEHCVECSAPACYATCDRFKRREDGDCVRLVGGMTPVRTDDGIGARCEFRTWAKIESQLKIRPLNGDKYAWAYKAITALGYFFRWCAAICPFHRLGKFIYDGWFSYRQKFITHRIAFSNPVYAVTLHGKVANDDHATTMLVDVKSGSSHLFRDAVEIPVGKSEFRVNIPPYESKKELYFINLHPANAEEHVALTFDRLELEPTDKTRGKKVKLVIWDLDNTLWNGVLIEDKDVRINQRFVELVKYLDSCGVVNSIVSKNNEEDAISKLEEFGISDYFVFKKINWEPKSVNIGKTIKQMNINANTVVFVDDNPFERNEVLLKMPSVTCVDPSEIEEFTKCSRFNMIVTEDSRKRRNTYKMMESMQKEEEEWSGDIDDFLRSCDIKLVLSSPTEKTIPRCYELLQRTNQLNSSGRRLTMDEVKALVADSGHDCYVLNSSDKFGDYGIVGFLIVDRTGEAARVTDFVISCRVANKKIEPTLINYFANKYGGSIMFDYKKTLRNGPMFSIIKELGMELASSADKVETYLCRHNDSYPKIVAVEDKTGGRK